ncbi:Retrovirus-related Pol polyprotein from transposon RE1-like protein [Drosera capensis]
MTITLFSISISINGLSSQELQSFQGLLSRSTHITTCWKKHEYPNQSPTPSARQVSAETPLTFTFTSGLSSHEFQSVRGLLSRSAHISRSSSWVIDFGTTNHITQSTILFMTETPHQFIAIVDGNIALDLRTQAVIGEGREAQGLYHLNAPPTALSAVSNPPPVPAPIPAPVPVPAPLQTYAQRVKQTIDKVIPVASHPLPMTPAPDDLPIALRWKAAMNEEMQALWENDTWDVVLIPPGQSCVSCRWIYTLDIKNAFLHGDLTGTVYMLQPPGYEAVGENHVCQLCKSLYGLKQSPRVWFEKFSKVVQVIGFSMSFADSLLFVHRRSQWTVILLIYVDDIITTRDDTAGIAKVNSWFGSTKRVMISCV